VYFNVNFNVFFKLMKVHLLVSELYISLPEAVTTVICQIHSSKLRKRWNSIIISHISNVESYFTNADSFVCAVMTLFLQITQYILSALLWSLFFAHNSVQTSCMPSWLVHCDNMVLFLHKLWNAIYFRSSYEKFERSRGGTSAEEMAAMPQRATLAWSDDRNINYVKMTPT